MYNACMYYHCRPLKYVEYGKVFPPPVETIDEYMVRCYRWVGYYCMFYPQVWLSRSNFSITGFKQKYSKENDSILFGFDILPGSFPIAYDAWEYLMNVLMNSKDNNISKINKKINKDFMEFEQDSIKEKWEPDGELKRWIDCGRNVDVYLKKHVFVEKDQVVVPSLNLKAAKKIICRNEKQRKALRHMGFIDDRIEIKNIKLRKW